RPLRTISPKRTDTANAKNTKARNDSDYSTKILSTSDTILRSPSASTVLIRSSSTGSYTHALGNQTISTDLNIQQSSKNDKSNSKCRTANILTHKTDATITRRNGNVEKLPEPKISELSLKNLKEQSINQLRSPPLSAIPLCSEIAAFFASDNIHCNTNNSVKKYIHVMANEKNPSIVTSSAVACADAVTVLAKEINLDREVERRSPTILLDRTNSGR
uniref:Product n=1 Tax=Ascaris lumbricoides TaxID=6252 RepID=A0A0M3IPZ2_ASCLU